MGETKHPQVHDFGIFKTVTKPQNQHHLSLETPGHRKQISKIPWAVFSQPFKGWKYFGDKYGAQGSRFGENVEVPKNIQKVLQ